MQWDGKGVQWGGYRARQRLMATAAGPAMQRRTDDGAQWHHGDDTRQRDDGDGAVTTTADPAARQRHDSAATVHNGTGRGETTTER